jgi:transposase-like protein
MNYFKTDEEAYRFAKIIGLIDSEKVCECERPMRLIRNPDQKNGEQFECTGGRGVCLKRKSVLSQSWFSNAKISIGQGLLIIMAHASEIKKKHLPFYAMIKSSKIQTDWTSFFRDIYAAELEHNNGQKIGGRNQTIEIDESLIFKRKSHVGRLLSGEESCQWVVGGICRESGDVFAVNVENRSSETLLRAILDNVNEGSRIITDCWRGYNTLIDNGFSHSRVNHRYNFVSPEDDTISTQRVERMWKTMKSIIPKEAKYDIR